MWLIGSLPTMNHTTSQFTTAHRKQLYFYHSGINILASIRCEQKRQLKQSSGTCCQVIKKGLTGSLTVMKAAIYGPRSTCLSEFPCLSKNIWALCNFLVKWFKTKCRCSVVGQTGVTGEVSTQKKVIFKMAYSWPSHWIASLKSPDWIEELCQPELTQEV